jgi:hypothetical protein
LAGFWQKYRISIVSAGHRHIGQKLLEPMEFGCSGQILASWQGFGRSGRDFLARSGRPTVLVGIFWSDPAGRNPAKWPEYNQFGRRNLGRPDSGEDGRIPLPDFDDIDMRLSDFGTDKFLVLVDCFNVKVEFVWRFRKMIYAF